MILAVDITQAIVAILNFTIPALIVFGVTYYLVQSFLNEQRKVRIIELKKEQANALTPIKLQAYERLTLLLDRIAPDNLVLRLSKAGQSAEQLRSELINTINTEFNHNIAQQIYVSNESWQMIKAVKEKMLTLIDQTFQECEPNETGPGLGKKILLKLISERVNPTQKAIELLKKEIEIVL